MSFKKRVSGSWTDTPNYIHNTATDTITTLPADIYPTGTTATVGLKGQMEQNGTPTPTTPIQPSETGDLSSNLWSGGNVSIAVGDRYKNILIDLPANTYTFKAKYSSTNTGSVTIGFYDENNSIHTFSMTQIDGTVSTSYTGIITAIRLYSAAGYTLSGSHSADFTDIMINLGSEALPYEPYGYKIPISSANTTTPIYLGEAQTTRKIKKLVLTGEENWYVEGSNIFYSDPITEAIQYPPICSHFIGVQALSDNNQVAISQSLRINIKTNSITHTTSDFKAYLQQQYTAGIPVCVWYILETPTTGIVNEPIRKIGDYADEVSGITIPTIAGGDTIDINTTLEPSEVSVNYHGWHPVIDTHRFNGTSWD